MWRWKGGSRCIRGRIGWCRLGRIHLRHDLMKLLHLLLNGWICGKHGLVLLHGLWLHGEGIDVGHRPVRI